MEVGREGWKNIGKTVNILDIYLYGKSFTKKRVSPGCGTRNNVLPKWLGFGGSLVSHFGMRQKYRLVLLRGFSAPARRRFPLFPSEYASISVNFNCDSLYKILIHRVKVIFIYTVKWNNVLYCSHMLVSINNPASGN